MLKSKRIKNHSILLREVYVLTAQLHYPPIHHCIIHFHSYACCLSSPHLHCTRIVTTHQSIISQATTMPSKQQMICNMSLGSASSASIDSINCSSSRKVLNRWFKRLDHHDTSTWQDGCCHLRALLELQPVSSFMLHDSVQHEIKHSALCTMR
jgi:hypothetical protein